MSAPWMPLYIADYLADTTQLTTAEHGAYLLLIMTYWRQGGLPDDDAMLARITRMTPKDWTRAKPVLSAFFEAGWKHARIEKELEKSARKSDARAESGSRGGNAKALKNKDATLANATVLPQQKDDFALASSSLSQSDAFSNEKAARTRDADFRSEVMACFRQAGQLSADTGRAVVWLANGWKPEICLAVIREVLGRKPDASMAYIEPAVRQAHENPAPSRGPPAKPARKSYLALAAELNGTSNERHHDSPIIDVSPIAAEGGGWPDTDGGKHRTQWAGGDYPGPSGSFARTAGLPR